MYSSLPKRRKRGRPKVPRLQRKIVRCMHIAAVHNVYIKRNLPQQPPAELTPTRQATQVRTTKVDVKPTTPRSSSHAWQHPQVSIMKTVPSTQCNIHCTCRKKENKVW